MSGFTVQEEDNQAGVPGLATLGSEAWRIRATHFGKKVFEGAIFPPLLIGDFT